MEFCECGSMMIGGNCTNKKCKKHVKKVEKAATKQVATIKALLERLDRDYNEAELKSMSSDDAEGLIYDLEGELEEALTKKDDEDDIEDEIIEELDLDDEDEDD